MKCKRARGMTELQTELSQQYPDKSDEQIQTLAEERAAELREAGLLIEQWDLDHIGADLTWCGRSGSPTKVHRIQSVVLRASGYKQFEPTDEPLLRGEIAWQGDHVHAANLLRIPMADVDRRALARLDDLTRLTIDLDLANGTDQTCRQQRQLLTKTD